MDGPFDVVMRAYEGSFSEPAGRTPAAGNGAHAPDAADASAPVSEASASPSYRDVARRAT
jgi:hypothetical protein